MDRDQTCSTGQPFIELPRAIGQKPIKRYCSRTESFWVIAGHSDGNAALCKQLAMGIGPWGQKLWRKMKEKMEAPWAIDGPKDKLGVFINEIVCEHWLNSWFCAREDPINKAGYELESLQGALRVLHGFNWAIKPSVKTERARTMSLGALKKIVAAFPDYGLSGTGIDLFRAMAENADAVKLRDVHRTIAKTWEIIADNKAKTLWFERAFRLFEDDAWWRKKRLLTCRKKMDEHWKHDATTFSASSDYLSASAIRRLKTTRMCWPYEEKDKCFFHPVCDFPKGL